MQTLPWSWYTDPEVLRREQERIFRSAWQYVGHRGLVAEHGDQFAAEAGDVPVLVVRDGEALRAFLNVCRHRGSQLVDGSGNGKSIQCPYHAWTYGLDGSLRAAPRADREAGFEAEGLSLVELRLEQWGPLLFVNPDAEAPPLLETLGPVPELVPLDGARVPRPRRLRARGELEDRLRELPRVLPLPGRAQGVQRCVRGVARLVPAGADGRARALAVCAVEGGRRGAVPFRLAKSQDQRLSGARKRVGGPDAARRARAVAGLPRLLLRARCRRGLDRGADGFRPPGRRRGSRSRRARAARGRGRR